MKKFLHKVWVMLMVATVSMPMWALEEVDGVYQISSAADLKAFAELVNGGQNTVSAVLTADIVADADQPMIGLTSATAFKGSFDGQGHTLTLNWTGDNALSQDPAALFPYLAGPVSNLRLDGTIEAKGARTGALAGRVEAAVTISNIISNVTMIGYYAGDSALSGLVARPSTAGVVIQNCLYTGTIISDVSVNVGALIGWNGAASTMLNCAFLGNIKIKDLRGNYNLTNVDSNVLGRFQNGTLTSSNCYYLPIDLPQEDLDAGYINVTGTLSGATAITADQIASGELCFNLNGEGETVWYQTIGTDPYPVLDKTHGVVYLNGRQYCDGTPYEGTEFSNENKGFTKDDHNFIDGVCTVCGAADPNFVTIGEDGFYSISNAGQFAWFASKVNSGNADLNARLTAAIDLEGVEWAPIGTVAVPYTGTFDGQMYPITNITNMLFGTINGAQITGVALESGEITDTNTDYAAHTGSIVGHSTAKEGSVTNSYSKVAMNGGQGDLGGISGKFLGTMKNVAFVGSLAGTLSTWSVGGLAGSTNSTNTTFISDCFVFADWGEGLDPAYGARGGIVGWCHTNTSTNCYVISDTFTKLLGDGTGSTEDCAFKTADEFNNGAVAWDLNGKKFSDVTWYQTLSDNPEKADPYPVLDPTHEIVYPTADGFASAGADNFDEMRKNLIAAEEAYCENAAAYVGAKDAYMEALQQMKEIADRDAFIEAYGAAKTLRAAIEASEKAYVAYFIFAQDILEKAKASSIGGTDMEFLMDYLENNWEPSDDYPNGSYIYIMENYPLDNEGLLAEQEFVDAMWQTAQKNGYTVGDEITNMLVNADLNNGFNGWEYTKEGSTFTTGGVKEVMPAAESWNATFDMKQTLTNLTNGFYKLQVNAAFRAAGDIYSTNYAAWTYLNNDETLIMTEGEDAVSEENAVDLQNCYINGGMVTDEAGAHISPYDYPYADYDKNVFGYVPYGPLSCSYAFNGGRYVNTIVTEVKDGELTVGLKLPGTGQGADWMGFGNFRLTYLGDADTEYTSAAYDETLAGMVARSNTILAYEGSSAEDYQAKPQFSAALREELRNEIAAVAEATTTAQKQELVARFAETFRNIYTCKKAYIAYFDRAQSLYSTGYAMVEDDNTLRELLEDYQKVLNEVIGVKWENGTYSEEDCEEMADLKATRLYQYLNANTPDIVGGKYQIATVKDLQWLARMANGGSTDIAAELTAPIDLAGVEWTPIGTVAAPYTGTFNGHLYPITNINNMLFGTITGAQITGIALESGEITDTNTDYAAHTGSIVGHSTAKEGSVTNSYSKVAMNGGQGDLGGISGKFLGTMKNVAFVGSLAGTLSTWSVGGLAGSTNSTNTTFISDCMVFCDWGDGLDPGYGARGGLVGWCHTNTVNTSYVIANSTDHPGFTKLLGDGTGSISQSEFKSLDQFASGEVAFLLNADQDQPAWFQTLGKDAYPVLDNTHLVVLKKEDGTYYNEGSPEPTVPEADLLDVVFHEDGTAEDVSPMHSTVELCGTTSSTYFNQTYQRYTARFENPWGKTCTGYYKVDFENNEAIRSALADGHTLEMLVMGEYEGAIQDVEAKPFSAMQGGGTGFLICKTNTSGRQNEFTFLPNVTETTSSTWRWTNSGIVPQPKTYYHVVGVWNKEESKAYIYVNGELCNTVDAPGEFRFANAGCNWFCIGGDADPSGGGQGWTGDVAIARAYDKALSQEEAIALWNKLSDETGIGVIAPEGAAPIGIFRLDGIRVDKAQQGIYVIDGKKTLVK